MDAPRWLFESGCAAVSTFDADALIELCTPDVEFSSSITALDHSRYHGPEGIRDFIANFAQAFEFVDLRPTQVFGAGDRWVMVNSFRARGRASGVEVEQTFYQAARIRDGRAASWAFYDTVDEAVAALGLDQSPPATTASSEP